MVSDKEEEKNDRCFVGKCLFHAFACSPLPLPSLKPTRTVAALSTTASATSTAPRGVEASSAALAVSASISGLELSVKSERRAQKASIVARGGGGAIFCLRGRAQDPRRPARDGASLSLFGSAGRERERGRKKVREMLLKLFFSLSCCSQCPLHFSPPQKEKNSHFEERFYPRVLVKPRYNGSGTPPGATETSSLTSSPAASASRGAPREKGGRVSAWHFFARQRR